MRFRAAFLVVAALLLLVSFRAGWCGEVRVEQTTLQIPLHAYEKGFFVPLPEDRLPGYPYPNLRQQEVERMVTPRDYRAIILENDYLKITILPDLGGRLYRLIYKPTGQSVFYENEPLKPTPFCEQGWWIATGGIEWCFPLTEHSTNTQHPWNYAVTRSSEAATVTVSDDHQRVGLSESVSITLEPGSCAFILDVRLSNPGFSPKQFMYWSNAMYPAHDGVEFIVPTHWTSYGPGSIHPWPVRNGKDLSRFDNWESFGSEFATKLEAGFAGVYDHVRDLGMVRTFPLGTARGVKIFSYGHTKTTYLQPYRYTDTEKSYFEMMGGYTSDFWAEDEIAPHQVVQWQERWYPVAATGGFNAACGDVAVRHEIRGDKSAERARLTVFASRDIPGAVVSILSGGRTVKTWGQDLACAEPVTLESDLPAGSRSRRVIVSANGKLLLSCQLDKPKSGLAEKQLTAPNRPDRAKPETVEQLLAADQPAEAAARFVKESSTRGKAAVAYGAALMRLGKTNEALRQLAKCRKSEPLACYLAGRILLQRGSLKDAKAMFEAAVRADDKDTRAMNGLAAVQRQIGDPAGAKAVLGKVLAQTPADLFANAELAEMRDASAAAHLEQFLLGEAQDWVYLALDYYSLGNIEKAKHYAERAARMEPANVTAQAVLLNCAVRRNDSAGAAAALGAIQSADVENAIIYGSDDAVAVLEEALRARPDSSRLMLYTATAYQIRSSPEAASAMAAEATKAEPTLARAYMIQAQCQTAYVRTEREYIDATKRAVTLVDKCLALNPQNPAYYYTAGWLYGDGNRRRARAAAMAKAVQLDPYCFPAYGIMGSEALDERCDFAEAVKWFKLEANSPQHSEGENDLAAAYLKWMKALLRENQREKLALVLDEAEKTPLSASGLDYRLARAEALEVLGRHDESRAALEALKAQKDDLTANGWMRDWYYLGCALDKLGDKDGARALWLKCKSSLEEILPKNPDWTYGTCLMALSLNKLGQHDEALRTIKKVRRQAGFRGYVRDALDEIGGAWE